MFRYFYIIAYSEFKKIEEKLNNNQQNTSSISIQGVNDNA